MCTHKLQIVFKIPTGTQKHNKFYICSNFPSNSFIVGMILYYISLYT